MRAIWAVASTDVARWRRSPVLVAATLVPAFGMALMVVALTYAVGRQPVALVVEGRGPVAEHIVEIIRGSDGFFLVERTAAEAAKDLKAQRVAAVITIPADFDQRVATHDAEVGVLINNVDLDFSDDVRRSVNEAVVEIDAPSLATLGENDLPPGTASGLPNPYRVDVAETDLRTPDVSFLAYQVVPVLALLSLTAGTLVTALGIAGERESGALGVVALSPAPRPALVAGRLLGGTVAAAALLGLVVGACALLGVLNPPSGRWPLLALLLLVTAIGSVGLGVLVGLATRRVTTTAMLGVNVATASFLLGGGFTTIAFLPSFVQGVARFFPTYYAVEGVREVLFYERMPGLGRNLAVLLATAAVSLLVGSLALSRAGSRR
ncbi:MAG: type transport system permease protein [Frankiaceae bacterium]|jgi:ABC-2 type transport system permease protein|nr:type transport system permease protein [Frankiaceae bacterium]